MIAIGEASRLSGVSIETIRYYEREGIISKAVRTASGRRAYSDTEISELRFIKRCRDLGFSIQDAVALRNLADAPTDACETVERLGSKHLSDVQAKLAELRKLEKALVELVANFFPQALAVAFACASVGHLAQVLGLAGYGESRELVTEVLEVELEPIGESLGVFDGLGKIGE